MSKNFDSNPLHVARKLGYSIAGEIGKRAMEELELCYASGLLPKFSDDPITRVKTHILLYWKPGFYKSTLLQEFSKTIPLKTVNITSMTVQKIFGSVDAKHNKIVLPAFTKDVRFVIVSELTALLGQKEAMREFVNVMNQVLEGQGVYRQTISLGYGKIGQSEIQKCKDKGVSYEPEEGRLSYHPDVCVMAASRPLDNRYFNYLYRSGHFSRYHVIQRRISPEEAVEHLKKNYIIDTSLQNQLKELNAKLAEVKVKVMYRPPEESTNQIFVDLEKLTVDEIAGRQNISLPDVLTPRVKDDVLRELVSHAFLRTASQNNFSEIEKLEYTAEDVNYIKEKLYHFIDFTLNPLIAPGFVKTSRQTKKDRVKKAILEYLEKQKESHSNEIFRHIELSGIKVSQATIYIALKELMEEERIKSPSFGYYEIISRKRNSKGGEDNEQ